MKKPEHKKPKKPVNKQAQADLDTWQNTPAVNPLYQGKTPLDMAKVLLKPPDPSKRKGK